MSERGSFVTEYIYCEKCFEAAKGVLIAQGKYLCSTVVPGWNKQEPELPIIAGKLGGLYAGEELVDFEFEYAPRLEDVLCHSMRVAVLAEKGERIFTVMPTEKPVEG